MPSGVANMTDNMLSAATDGGHLVKMEVDYSATCDEKIPALKKEAAEGRVQDAINGLLALEKQTRTGADMHSTSRVLVAIVQVCFDAKDLNLLNESIITLTKRRSQLKQSVAKMVQEACTYVDKLTDKEQKLKLIDTLRTVTEGKIYVEIERARLTHKLAMMKEADGDIVGAADILQEMQVETYGSMEKTEKVTLILEQMRLCLLKKDYIRTQIIAKKINVKFFEAADTHELKMKYYNLMIELDQNIGSNLSICKHYLAIYNTPSVQEDETKKTTALRHAVLYLVLASYDNEQSDLTHRLLQDKTLELIPTYKSFVELFVNAELIRWAALVQMYEAPLRKGSAESPATDVFSDTEAGNKRWQQLKKRCVEHNIDVMSRYYRRVRLSRMAQLLELTEAETEEFLSQMVVGGAIQAKTDRLEGIVSFIKTKDPTDILTEWSSGISSLMMLVTKTTHLINKEEMVHKHLLPSAD
ncbi:26S proteasome non-ATPase regulatory subunit 12-like isoform X3 [Amphibalanus amphitrite]|uniref:26S proteasome non-ATPase regulatory subunit 12-like isoform X3 n=1 Tax=Amphibalanus amphitrite TaxID=1232801 RepID=UPI001C922713|nr:26S proteasome non-ATPase regulatory subunit 12-like isoform X3 [Amphibalanus amphitrite]